MERGERTTWGKHRHKQTQAARQVGRQIEKQAGGQAGRQSNGLLVPPHRN